MAKATKAGGAAKRGAGKKAGASAAKRTAKDAPKTRSNKSKG